MRALAAAAENLSHALPPGVPRRLNDITERLARDLYSIERASVETTKGKPMTDDAAKPPAGEGPVTKVSGPPPKPTLSPAAPVPASVMEDGVERVEGKGLTLLFEARKCIHSRHCVLEQPAVFKANVEGPWIDPDATSVESLVALAHKCPSNAIRYRRKDGVPDEGAPPVNLLQVRENGPLGVRAELVIDGAAVGYRATLCRCGASKRKPFCDGSHGTIGFSASGEPATQTSEPLAVRNGPLDVRPQRNGPLAVSGNLELISGTGRTVHRLTTARLCRCGGSSNKPFCDGTHARNGFISD